MTFKDTQHSPISGVTADDQSTLYELGQMHAWVRRFQFVFDGTMKVEQCVIATTAQHFSILRSLRDMVDLSRVYSHYENPAPTQSRDCAKLSESTIIICWVLNDLIQSVEVAGWLVDMLSKDQL